jgi:hypothetical protein
MDVLDLLNTFEHDTVGPSTRKVPELPSRGHAVPSVNAVRAPLIARRRTDAERTQVEREI